MMDRPASWPSRDTGRHRGGVRGASPTTLGASPTTRAATPATRGATREAGGIPIEFALGVGVLVLPVALLVLTLPTWVERQSAARLAAREAARTVVLADSLAAGVAAGEHAAARVAANHGIDPGDFSVTFAGSLTRGDSVTAILVARFPATVFPGLGEVAGFDRTITHTEHVDYYRSFP